MWWTFKPGTQYPTDVIWQEDAQVYLRMDDILADEGAKAVITKAWVTMMEEDARRKREAMPENLEWLVDLDKSQRQQPNGLGMILPSQLSLILVPAGEPNLDGESETDVVLAMNFRTMVRPFKAFISWAARQEEGKPKPIEHKGFEILDMDHGNYMSFADSTVIFASSLPTLKKTLDRVATAQPTLPAIDLPEGRWDLIGHSINSHGETEKLLDRVAEFNRAVPVDTESEEFPLEDIEATEGEGDDSEAIPTEAAASAELESEDPNTAPATQVGSLGPAEFAWGIDFESADRAVGKFRLEVGDPAQIDAWRQRVLATLAALDENLSDDIIQIETSVSGQGNQLAGEVRIRGLERSIEEFFQNFLEFQHEG